MLRLALGAALGYFFGTKAGRERYHQILGLGTKVKENPTVQAAAGYTKAKVTAVVPGYKEPVAVEPDLPYPAEDAERPSLPLS